MVRLLSATTTVLAIVVTLVLFLLLVFPLNNNARPHYSSTTTLLPGVNPPPPATPTPAPQPDNNRTCPVNALKLEVCLKLLVGLGHVEEDLDHEVEAACCPLFANLLSSDVVLCLCLSLDLLGLKILLPIALDLLVLCGNPPPPTYHCPFPLTTTTK